LIQFRLRSAEITPIYLSPRHSTAPEAWHLKRDFVVEHFAITFRLYVNAAAVPPLLDPTRREKKRGETKEKRESLMSLSSPIYGFSCFFSLSPNTGIARRKNEKKFAKQFRLIFRARKVTEESDKGHRRKIVEFSSHKTRRKPLSPSFTSTSCL
jgi:hypothetical protein